MLGTWRSHAEYQTYLLSKLKELQMFHSKVIKGFTHTILKLWRMNLDTTQSIFAPLFATAGRPSNQQPEMTRLFILMVDQKEHNIGQWLKTVAITPLFCALVGLAPDELPGESTLRDFITRLWQADELNHEKPPNIRPKEKYGKKKQPPKRPGIIRKLVKQALAGEVFADIPERTLQTIFSEIALTPSKLLGLLGDTQTLKISGDGTCVESHANPRGRKTCECIHPCDCNRRFADPDAAWGWDSYHERYFYGHHLYMLSTRNTELTLDLPVYLRFANASQFDGVSLIEVLAHARNLYNGFLSFDSLIADSAHDNYATYELLHHFRIKPFIDLNPRSSDQLKPQRLPLSRNHIPICADGYEMVNWGYDANKSRIKFRCPLITRKVKNCPYSGNCNKTSYGKIVYLRLSDDLRFLTPVPRDSDIWIAIYKLRTASERVNNRILTDYQLEHSKRYGRKKLAFFAFLNAINVHLDAHAKFGNTVLADLVV